MTLSDKQDNRQKVTKLVTDMTVDKSISEEFLIDEFLALLSQVERDSRLDEVQKMLDMDVPASYTQDGKDWQGLAVPRNLLRKRLAELSLEPGREATNG